MEQIISSCCHTTASFDDENGIHVCDDCFNECELVSDEEDEPYCSTCNGSGEGPADGTRCWNCKGSGVEKRVNERV